MAIKVFAQKFQLDGFFCGSWDYGQHIPVEKPLFMISFQFSVISKSSRPLFKISSPLD